MDSRIGTVTRYDHTESAPAYPEVWLGSDGILRVDYGFHASVTLALVQEANRRHRALMRDRKLPVLVQGHGILDVDWSAYRYAADPAVVEVTAATALLTSTPLERYLSQIFLLYHRPPYPCRVFSTDSEALDWLSQFAHAP